MNIGIDSGPLKDGNSVRGVGVYTRLLYDSLSKLAKGRGDKVYLVSASNLDKDLKIDILHYPYFDFFQRTLFIPQKLPIVVTIHDTIPLIYPKQYPTGIKGKLTFLRQKNSLKHASAIITDSNTSKKDIVRFLGVSANKIYPSYLGSTVATKNIDTDEKLILKKFKINYKYAIYVGDVNWNKNLPNLAFVCELSKIHLVIVGKRAKDTNFDKDHIENRPLLELQEKYGNSEYVHRVGYVEDFELPVLIKNAEVLCQPSYYEGFGLNVLDAMSLGVPTLCAKTQALVEIYEGATVFFDPYNNKEMQSKLMEVFVDKKLKIELIAKGVVHSKKFSWSRNAKEAFEIYESVTKEQV